MKPIVARIKCPKCGVELDVRNTDGVEIKNIVCPNCQAQLAIRFKVKPQQAQAPSQDEVGTDLLTNNKGEIGSLRFKTHYYELKEGINTVGRKASTSSATIQIPTDDRYMSRLHIIIEVQRLSNGSYKHIIQNGNNKNPTYVNGQLMNGSDRLVLEGGNTIKMGDTTLTFVASEEDGTDF